MEFNDMSDCTYTTIQFSGVVTKDVAEGLVRQLNWRYCLNQLDDGRATLENLNEIFYDGEANYGNIDDVEDYCKSNFITYLKTWQAGGGYGPGMELYHAIANVSTTCSMLEGEPVLTLDDLIKAHDEGSLDAMIGYLKSFVDFDENNPPLEVQEDDASCSA